MVRARQLPMMYGDIVAVLTDAPAGVTPIQAAPHALCGRESVRLIAAEPKAFESIQNSRSAIRKSGSPKGNSKAFEFLDRTASKTAMAFKTASDDHHGKKYAHAYFCQTDSDSKGNYDSLKCPCFEAFWSAGFHGDVIYIAQVPDVDRDVYLWSTYGGARIAMRWTGRILEKDKRRWSRGALKCALRRNERPQTASAPVYSIWTPRRCRHAPDA